MDSTNPIQTVYHSRTQSTLTTNESIDRTPFPETRTKKLKNRHVLEPAQYIRETLDGGRRHITIIRDRESTNTPSLPHIYTFTNYGNMS